MRRVKAWVAGGGGAPLGETGRAAPVRTGAQADDLFEVGSLGVVHHRAGGR